MEIKITKEKAIFNKSCFGNEKNVVLVEFPNCISTKTKKPFKWLPTYVQLNEIKKNLDEIEKESWNGSERKIK